MRVSVIIPCFNSERYLAQCIESVLCQTHKDFEILACDDGSHDSTSEILNEFKQLYPDKISVFSNDVNVGAGLTRKKLLNICNGDLIAFLDADDFWTSTKLEKCVDHFIKTGSDIVFHDNVLIDADGVSMGMMNSVRRVGKYTLFARNPFPTSGTVFKSDLDGVLEMPILRKRQDYGYWLNIVRKNPRVQILKIEETLGYYRILNGSLSSNKFNNLKYNYLAFRFAGYNRIQSSLFVFVNSVERVMRSVL